MDGPIQNVLPNILNGWTHTECFTKHTTWMAPYRMFLKTCKMDGPIQNVFPHILNGLPHSECFSKHAKWMAAYRMIIQMY